MSRGFRPSFVKKKRRDYRWLRSNGTPNFDDRIYRLPGDMEIIAKKPVLTIAPSTPLLRAVEIMANTYRSLVVAVNNYLKGLLLATHLINYLGGGEYFRIVGEKHSYNIFSALNKEIVESIMEREPIVVHIDEKLTDVLEKMVVENIGVVPVVERDGRVYGIITEHDLVKYLYGLVSIGISVSDIMSKPVVTINIGSSVKQAMEKMISFGFRRIPVVDGNRVVGIVTAIDIIKYFDPRSLFKRITSSDINSVLNNSIDEVMNRELVVVKSSDDLAKAVNKMLDKNTSSVLVVDENMALQGIVTERDVLYALTIKK